MILYSFEKFNESRDTNDPLMVKLRAEAIQRLKEIEKLKASKEKNNAEKALDKKIQKDVKQIERLKFKLEELQNKSTEVYKDMENDPDVELEGGRVANHYGSILNRIDKQIQKVRKQIEILENPVLASKKLETPVKIGVFDN